MSKTALKPINIGDTSPTYEIGVEEPDGSLRVLDANYTLYYKEADNLFNGTSTDISNDRLLLTLSPSDTALLSVGTAQIKCKVENLTLAPPFVRSFILKPVVQEGY